MPLPKDVLTQAVAKIGVTETPPGSKHNEFTQWFGVNGAWCAMFVSWCCAHGGFSTDDGATLTMDGVKQTTAHGWAYVPYLLNNFRDAGRVVVDPAPGDIVTFEWDGDSIPDHTGLVQEVRQDGTLVTIEGNHHGRVDRLFRARSVVAGFCRPPYDASTTTTPPITPPGVPPFPGFCSIGSRDNATRKVQQRLRDRGWTIDVDGVFGPGTLAVVKAFQARRGLGADGIVGPQTWNSLWTP